MFVPSRAHANPLPGLIDATLVATIKFFAVDYISPALYFDVLFGLRNESYRRFSRFVGECDVFLPFHKRFRYMEVLSYCWSFENLLSSYLPDLSWAFGSLRNFEVYFCFS